MLRRLIKTGIATGLHFSGTASVIGARRRRKYMPLVVGYHRVVEDFRDCASRAIPPMLISTNMLARHLDWIGRRFEFVTLDDVAAWAEGRKEFDKPVAAVTFDEGYADVYHHGFRVLRGKGVPAAVFALTDLIGTRSLPIHDELYLLLSAGLSVWPSPRQRISELLYGLGIEMSVASGSNGSYGVPYRVMRALLESVPQTDLLRICRALGTEIEIPEDVASEHRCMSWAMLCEMQRAGMTIGSHTSTHAILTNECEEKVFEEAMGSRSTAEQACGAKIEHFAYPDGRFNAAVVRAVAAAGYRSAYTICEHRHPVYPRLTIPRRIFWEKSCLDVWGRFSPSIMSCQINGVFDGANRCVVAHGI